MDLKEMQVKSFVESKDPVGLYLAEMLKITRSILELHEVVEKAGVAQKFFDFNYELETAGEILQLIQNVFYRWEELDGQGLYATACAEAEARGEDPDEVLDDEELYEPDYGFPLEAIELIKRAKKLADDNAV